MDLDSGRLKELALAEGYDLAGICEAKLSQEDISNLREFVSLGHHAGMSWFSKLLEIRTNPELFLPGAKSALVLGLSYRSQESETMLGESDLKISRYAVGRDYHRVLKKKGLRLLASIASTFPEIQGRVSVDSAPVPEKIFGRMAGIGWQGKHTNLIHPRLGSYFFLSVVLLDRVFASDVPITDGCKTCRKCIDACPTHALEEYRIDSRKCISYLTIEEKGKIPSEFHGKTEGWIFGCDICQEVCPYNSRKSAHVDTKERAFFPRKEILPLLEKEDPGREVWEIAKTGSPLGRIDYERLLDRREASGLL